MKEIRSVFGLLGRTFDEIDLGKIVLAVALDAGEFPAAGTAQRLERLESSAVPAQHDGVLGDARIGKLDVIADADELEGATRLAVQRLERHEGRAVPFQDFRRPDMIGIGQETVGLRYRKHASCSPIGLRASEEVEVPRRAIRRCRTGSD